MKWVYDGGMNNKVTPDDLRTLARRLRGDGQTSRAHVVLQASYKLEDAEKLRIQNAELLRCLKRLLILDDRDWNADIKRRFEEARTAIGE